MKTSGNDKRWAQRYPELGTGPVPIGPYISTEYFELERKKLFKHCWLNVGRVKEVLKVGDYFVKDIAVLKTSLIIARGQDGVIRGFHNVCRHRGYRIEKAGIGSARSFVCGFHGWTYGLDGQLVHIPDEKQFYDLSKAEHGLTPVATDVWEGFIFVNADARLRETLQESMDVLGKQLSGYPFGTMPRIASYAAEVNVNWKIFMDIFQECYHVPNVHNRSVADAGTGKDNPFCHLLSVRLYERHRSASVYINPDHKPAPAEALAYKYGATLIQQTSANRALPDGVNPERESNWLFDINVIFPNFILDLSNGSYWTYHFWPIAVDRTLWEARLYMNEARNAGEEISQEFNKVLLRDTLREDLSTLESIQANLTSGALTHIELSDQEIAIRHAHKVVEDLVRAGKGHVQATKKTG